MRYRPGRVLLALHPYHVVELYLLLLAIAAGVRKISTGSPCSTGQQYALQVPDTRICIRTRQYRTSHSARGSVPGVLVADLFRTGNSIACFSTGHFIAHALDHRPYLYSISHSTMGDASTRHRIAPQAVPVPHIA
eukprot:2929541-Rhodomonas_salina.8